MMMVFVLDGGDDSVGRLDPCDSPNNDNNSFGRRSRGAEDDDDDDAGVVVAGKAALRDYRIVRAWKT